MSLRVTNSASSFDAASLVRFTVENELKWFDIIKNIADGVFITDTESRIIYLNQAARRLLGITHQTPPRDFDDFIKMFRPRATNGKMITPEDLPFAHVFATGSFKNIEMIIKPRHSNHERHLSFSGALVPDARGRPVAGLCLARDHTESRQNLQELQLFNNALKTIMDTTEILNSSLEMKKVLPQSIMRLLEAFQLTAGLVYLVNEERQTLHLANQVGLTRAETESLNIEKFGQGVSGKVAASLKVMIIEDFVEYPHLIPLNRFRSAISLPLILADHPIGVLELLGDEPRIFSHHDVVILSAIATQMSVALENARRYHNLLVQNEELLALNTQLHEIDAEKNDFLSLIAHDFRTPLAIIDNYARLMINDPEHDPKDTQPLRSIIAECRRLNHLAGDTIAISRLETGGLQLALRPVSLPMLIPPLIEEVAGAAPQCRITCDIEPSSALVLADMQRIEEVIDNLLTNAVKYSPVGGEIEVHVSDTAEHLVTNTPTRLTTGALHSPVDLPGEGFVLVTVRDHGIGIEQQAAEKLFTKYYRVKTPAATGIKGTGLGLYICKKIVEAHGGRIGVYSTPGNGSCFYFTLQAIDMSKV